MSSKKATKEGVERGPVFTERLPVKVGPEVVERAAHQLARLHADLDALNAERRETFAEFRDRIDAVRERMGELATTVNTSTEVRDVRCREVLYVDDNRVDLVRLDTDEVVRRRPAVTEDRQESLAGLDKHPAPAGAFDDGAFDSEGS